MLLYAIISNKVKKGNDVFRNLGVVVLVIMNARINLSRGKSEGLLIVIMQLRRVECSIETGCLVCLVLLDASAN